MTHEDIPGWFNFEDLYDEAIDRVEDGAVLVEIGCWLGKSSAYLFQRAHEFRRRITLCYVDTWKGDPKEPVHFETVAAHGGDLYPAWLANMHACGAGLNPEEQMDASLQSDRPRVRPFQMLSTEAAANFLDGSVDFVFIDGAHDFDSVTADIKAWLPKLKPGGHIAGHDYEHPPLRAAVDALVTAAPRNASWERIPVPKKRK